MWDIITHYHIKYYMITLILNNMLLLKIILESSCIIVLNVVTNYNPCNYHIYMVHTNFCRGGLEEVLKIGYILGSRGESNY